MKEENYNHLIGKSYKEIFKELGNYYYDFSHPSRWVYKLKNTRIEHIFLYIYYDKNNIVHDVKLSKKYKIKWWNLFRIVILIFNFLLLFF